MRTHTTRAVSAYKLPGNTQESGDVLLSGCKVHAELGEVVSKPNRHNPERRTVFKSLGLAVEDVATAQLVLQLDAQEER